MLTPLRSRAAAIDALRTLRGIALHHRIISLARIAVIVRRAP